MKRRKPTPQSILITAAAVAWFGLALHAMTGCSTAHGFGTVMQGVGQMMDGLGTDIQHASEGTRERMSQD